MKIFEFKVLQVDGYGFDAKSLESELNQFGNDGWELKTAINLHYTLDADEFSSRGYEYNEKVLILQKEKQI